MRRMFSPRRVVYTSLFGPYEVLNEQACPNRSDIELICITDRAELQSDGWTISRVDTLGIDSVRESRRPKILPHRFLPDFDESLYIDNRFFLQCDPSELFERFLPRGGPGYATLPHPQRDCIYDEAEEVVRLQLDDEARVREQMDQYRRAGFPPHAGLVASGFILRRHGQEDVQRFGESWYAHVLRYSRRDQLSFNFVAWREKLTFNQLDIRLASNPFFRHESGGRRIPRNFDPQDYLWLNPDVAKAGVDPYEHMFRHGWREKRAHRYRPPLPLDVLANRYRSDKGSLYYNRHFYTRVYEHYLSPLRRETFTLLEIGLLRHDLRRAHRGGSFDDAPSLFMWDAYFERAQIHGIDLEDFSAAERGRITVTRADPSNPADLADALRHCRHDVRVVVDDGSRASRDQLTSLAFLFRHLAPGGLYFIECLNGRPGNREPPGSPETKDILLALGRGERPTAPHVPDGDLAYLAGETAEILFFDSMDYLDGAEGADSLAVIRKR